MTFGAASPAALLATAGVTLGCLVLCAIGRRYVWDGWLEKHPAFGAAVPHIGPIEVQMPGGSEATVIALGSGKTFRK